MLKKKLKNHERIKHILFLIEKIILEFFILIDLFIFIYCFFQIIYFLQLNYHGFLFLSYRFLKTVQNPKMRTENSTFCRIIKI